VVSTNSIEDNVPASIGKPVPGVQVKLGGQGRAPGQRAERDARLLEQPGGGPRRCSPRRAGLNTGDTARFDADGRIYITGRLKEIIVMSNGEKVPPVDIGSRHLQDALFEQVMVLGEGKPYLTVFVGAQPRPVGESGSGAWTRPNFRSAMRSQQAGKVALERIQRQIKTFPGYAQVHRAAILAQPWTIENGMLTPTMKLKRAQVMEVQQEGTRASFMKATEKPAAGCAAGWNCPRARGGCSGGPDAVGRQFTRATSSRLGSCRRWMWPAASRRCGWRAEDCDGCGELVLLSKQPVMIGDLVSFYADIVRVGRTSITVDVEVYAAAAARCTK